MDLVYYPIQFQNWRIPFVDLIYYPGIHVSTPVLCQGKTESWKSVFFTLLSSSLKDTFRFLKSLLTLMSNQLTDTLVTIAYPWALKKSFINSSFVGLFCQIISITWIYVKVNIVIINQSVFFFWKISNTWIDFKLNIVNSNHPKNYQSKLT